MNNYYLMIFKNTHDAIEGERVLKGNNVNITIMPTPTYITQSCGICIKFQEPELNKIEELVRENKVIYKNIYFRDENSAKEIILG